MRKLPHSGIRVSRSFALLLSIALGLPNPALAMRGEVAVENKIASGLEEALQSGPDATVQEISHLARSIVHPASPITPSVGLEERPKGFEKLMKLLPVLEGVLHEATMDPRSVREALRSRESEIEGIGLSYQAIDGLLFDQQALAELEQEFVEQGWVSVRKGITLHDGAVRARLQQILFPLQLLMETQPPNLSVEGIVLQIQVILEDWEEKRMFDPAVLMMLGRKSFVRHTRQIVQALFQIAGPPATGLEEAQEAVRWLATAYSAYFRTLTDVHDARPGTFQELQRAKADVLKLAQAANTTIEVAQCLQEFDATLGRAVSIKSDAGLPTEKFLQSILRQLLEPQRPSTAVSIETTGLEEPRVQVTAISGTAVQRIGQAIQRLTGLEEARAGTVGYVLSGKATIVAALTLSSSSSLPLAAVVDPRAYAELHDVATAAGLEEGRFQKWASEYLLQFFPGDPVLTRDRAVAQAGDVLALRFPGVKISFIGELSQARAAFGRTIETILRSFGVNTAYKNLRTLISALYEAAQA